MGKKNKDNKEKVAKVKKAPDFTAQLVRKAKNTYQSSGARGLFRLVDQYPELTRNRTVSAMLVDAKSRPLKPKKGQRGPAPKRKNVLQEATKKAQAADREYLEALASDTIGIDDEVWTS